jgi:hypothetical protein
MAAGVHCLGDTRSMAWLQAALQAHTALGLSCACIDMSWYLVEAISATRDAGSPAGANNKRRESERWTRCCMLLIRILKKSEGGTGKGPPKKKKKHEKKSGETRPTDFSFFFPFFFRCPFEALCASAVDMPPQMGTRSWLRGLPLRASSLW